MNLNRIGLTVVESHQHAVRLYEKLGFQREGTMREYFVSDGKRMNMLVYGFTKSEYEQSL